jgi:hypothetical protein
MESNIHVRGTMGRRNKLNDTDPSFSVHIPIIPHSGIKIVTTLVTTNCNVDGQINENAKTNVTHTIFFVLIFQCLWMYQKTRVLTVEVIACDKPK